MCGLAAGTVPSNVIKPIKTEPIPVPPDVEDGGSTLPSSQWARTIIILLPLPACCVFALYAIDQNFVPSELTTRVGLFIWVPLGFAYLMFVGRNTALRRGYVCANLKSMALGVISTVLDFFYIYTITIYGMPALANRIVGEPFQSQTVVTEKSTMPGYLGAALFLKDYNKAFGNKILTSRSVYQEVKTGDAVTVYGVESALGRSIDRVTLPPRDL